jgi:hypothetical protein
MRIQKAIHACDDKDFYLDFWPIVSKIWKVKFNVEPVLLHFGEKSPTTEWGTVVKMPILKDIPVNTQCQISRYWIPTTDLSATWITSDIDMLPISRDFFVRGIEGISDDKFVALKEQNPNEPFPMLYSCCYNIAKGHTFKEILGLPDSWEAFANSGFWKENTHNYMVAGLNQKLPHWGADEQWSSRQINSFGDQKRIVRIYREGAHNARRIDRLSWRWDDNLIRKEYYYDCHCARPYSDNKQGIDSIVTNILNPE